MTVVTMIERMAIAMREELGLDWPYTGHKELLDTARAALTAMREPTEVMKEAAVRHGGWSWWFDAAYIAMIDAALAEVPQ